MSKSKEVYERAVNPRQYDAQDLSWEMEAKFEISPFRRLCWEYIAPFAAPLKGKRILDMGAGSGWLLKKIREIKPAFSLGIEPSEKNVATAHRVHPDLNLIQSSLEAFETEEHFDGVFAIHVFSHIEHIEAALSKIAGLLSDQGRLVMIVPDFEYERTPRFGYKMFNEPINEEEYVSQVERRQGTMADIIRTNGRYIRAAEQAGLALVQQVAMVPTQDLLETEPRYVDFAGKPLAQLLVFEKR